jgi:hypothetical protein
MFIFMDSDLIRRFADAIILLIPDLQTDSVAIQASIKTHGLETFIKQSDPRVAGLTEIAGLFARLGGNLHEAG